MKLAASAGRQPAEPTMARSRRFVPLPARQRARRGPALPPPVAFVRIDTEPKERPRRCEGCAILAGQPPRLRNEAARRQVGSCPSRPWPSSHSQSLCECSACWPGWRRRDAPRFHAHPGRILVAFGSIISLPASRLAEAGRVCWRRPSAGTHKQAARFVIDSSRL